MDFPQNALGISHKFIAEHVHSGHTCIDATAGRGRDTLFLCELVGESGTVFAFDVQKEAIESTGSLLRSHGKTAKLILDCHSKMDQYIQKDSVDAIMFNFGWLPGGDHAKFSHGNTSCLAIEKGLELLKIGGVMSLCIYCGKETGFEEKETLLPFLKSLDQKKYSVLLTDYINRGGNPPICVLITKDA